MVMKEGPNYEWLESVPTYQTLKITAFVVTTVSMFSSGALAVDEAIVVVGGKFTRSLLWKLRVLLLVLAWAIV